MFPKQFKMWWYHFKQFLLIDCIKIDLIVHDSKLFFEYTTEIVIYSIYLISLLQFKCKPQFFVYFIFLEFLMKQINAYLLVPEQYSRLNLDWLELNISIQKKVKDNLREKMSHWILILVIIHTSRSYFRYKYF